MIAGKKYGFLTVEHRQIYMPLTENFYLHGFFDHDNNFFDRSNGFCYDYALLFGVSYVFTE